jgi:prevent-host-death family protein
MSDTYTIKTAQQKFSAVVKECEDHPVTITKQGKAVAVLVSMDRMEAIAETMEILADPKAMGAIHKHRKGKAVYHDLTAMDSV